MQITQFGKMIRKYRIDKDVILKDMAASLGVSSAYLSSIELGKRKIPDDFVTNVAKYFDLDIAGVEALKEAAELSQPSAKVDLSGDCEDTRALFHAFARTYKTLDENSKQEIRDLLERNKQITELNLEVNNMK